jgi:uncharacterized protein (DUF1501 family)
MISRRLFLRRSGLFAVSYGLSPLFLERSLRAASGAASAAVPPNGRILVVIFQRGAMDGLSMVPPLGDPGYAAGRPSIALQTAGDRPAVKLSDPFWLHPSLAPLKPLWDEGTLAFVHQVGSPDGTRSHFDAQDFMETGTPGDKNTDDGFLNRALVLNRLPSARGADSRDPEPLRAVALQPTMPRILQGRFPAISMNSIHDYNIKAGFTGKTEVQGFEQMYAQAADQVFRGIGREIFDSLHTVEQTARENRGRPPGGYPKAPIGKRLQEIAELVRSRVGLQVAVTDMGGWDTHVGQGNHRGQLADRFRELASALAAFRSDLGGDFQQTCVLTVTEFGRTVKENGTHGTDHGHGSVMMALGGGVAGGRVLGQWKPLAAENLYEGRDVPVTTDFRDVFAEVLTRHLGMGNLGGVFPKYTVDPKRWLGILRA